jgi:hypothetical protein
VDRITNGLTAKGNDMTGLGRYLAMQNLGGGDARRNADDEWRALHRRPDALPLPDDEVGIVSSHQRRTLEALRIRSLIARFGQH